VYDQIRNQPIVTKRHMPSTDKSKQPTMLDVAEKAGVSAMTVSRALKHDSYIKEETRIKIMRAVDELGYVLDNTAAGLSSRKSGFVAMIIPSINNANFAQTVSGVTEVLEQCGLQLLLAHTNYDEDAEEQLVAQLLSRRPQAIILTGSNHTQKCVSMLKNANIPVIEVWDIPDNTIDYCVGFSYREAAAMMVDHFVEKGCKKLAFVGGDSTSDPRGRARRLGFIEAVRKKNLDEPELIDVGHAPVLMEHGTLAAKELIKSGSRPDAVMCVSDLIAFGFMSECQRNHIKIPGEMLIAGFGAYDISDTSHPTITTIDASARKIGTIAGQIISDLSNDTDILKHRHLLPFRLIERESTRI